jgi:hypothetical protein
LYCWGKKSSLFFVFIKNAQFIAAREKKMKRGKMAENSSSMNDGK